MSNKNKKTNCVKVKNACKYCHEQVTSKNGLQCQGACQKWAHFKCLNYTPGKISDVKAGIIKVMCPCPDCDSSQAKEYLTNPPYSCAKTKCPANNKGPIMCELDECPEHSEKHGKECSSETCADEATKNSPPCMRKQPDPTTVPRPPTPPIRLRPDKDQGREYRRIDPISSSDGYVIPDYANRPSNSSSVDDCPKAKESMVEALQEMCGTVGKLSIQIKDLMGKINKMA